MLDGTDADHTHCPCFGDQPLIGADAYAFVVSTAEYDLHPFGAHFNGAQVYAFDKAAMAAGEPAFGVHDSLQGVTRFTGTLQPAFSPDGIYDPQDGGTEYLVSGFDCSPPDCAIAPGQKDKLDVWALSNTSSIQAGRGMPVLRAVRITSEVYGQPPAMDQQPGPTPLATSLGEPDESVDPNDNRVNQVEYAAGLLWTAITTIVAGEARDRSGIAWFVIAPSGADASLSAAIQDQGYLAVDRTHLAYPSIGVTPAGSGVIAYSLIGHGNYPSAAISAVGLAGAEDGVHISAAGARPDDGFSTFPEEGGNGVGRWGDYSAALAAPDGTLWYGVEYISNGPRTTLANWGTFIGHFRGA